MAFDAGSAVTTLGLDNSNFLRGMLQAEGLMSVFPSQVTNFMASPLIGLIGVFSDFTSAAIGAFNQTTANADAMNDMAMSVGVAVEALSGLSLVAQQAGSGAEAVVDSYRQLGRSLAEVANDSKGDTAQLFDRLGIGAFNAQGGLRAVEDVMLDLADAIARLPEGAERTSVAMELLGRGGTQLVPTLMQGSAAIRDQIETFKSYGAVVTAESASSADAWGDAMGEMSIAWEGIKMQLAEPIRSELLPHLQQIIDWLRDHAPEIRQGINLAIEEVGDFLRTVVNFVTEHRPLLEAIGATAVAIGTVTLALNLLSGPLAIVTGGLGAASAAWASYTAGTASAAAATTAAASSMIGMSAALGAAIVGYALMGQAALDAARDNMTLASALQENVDKWNLLRWLQSHTANKGDILLIRQEALAERLANEQEVEAGLLRRLGETPTADVQLRLELQERIAQNAKMQLELAEKMRAVWAGIKDNQEEIARLGRDRAASIGQALPATAFTDADVKAFAERERSLREAAQKLRMEAAAAAAASAQAQFAPTAGPTISASQRAAAAAVGDHYGGPQRFGPEAFLVAPDSFLEVVEQGETAADKVRAAFTKMRSEFEQRVQLAVDLGTPEQELQAIRAAWAGLVRQFAEQQLRVAVDAGAGMEQLNELRRLLAELIGQARQSDPLAQVRESFLRMRAEFEQRVQLAIDIDTPNNELASLRDSWRDVAARFADQQLRVAIDAGAGIEQLNELRRLLAQIVTSPESVERAATATILPAMQRFQEAREALEAASAEQVKGAFADDAGDLPARLAGARKSLMMGLKDAGVEQIKLAIDEGATHQQIAQMKEQIREAMRESAREAHDQAIAQRRALPDVAEDAPAVAAARFGDVAQSVSWGWNAITDGAWDAAAGTTAAVGQMIGVIHPIVGEVGALSGAFGQLGSYLPSLASGFASAFPAGAVSFMRGEVEALEASMRRVGSMIARGSRGGFDRPSNGDLREAVQIGDPVFPIDARQLSKVVVEAMKPHMEGYVTSLAERIRADSRRGIDGQYVISNFGE